jgi:hypothetical protein
MDSLQQLIRSVYKTILHLLTQKCEVERLTLEFPTSANKRKVLKQVRHSIERSKTLIEPKQIIVKSYEDFSVENVVENIQIVKKFHKNLGLVSVVTSFRMTNIGIENIVNLAKKEFSSENERVLIELWDSLQPNKQREGHTLRHSSSWSDIGFQGLDPVTDFRGGGVLSLENLAYFARESPENARRILNDHCQDIIQGGFPFAVAGINITAFLLNLVQKRKLDDLFVFFVTVEDPMKTKAIDENESTPLLGRGDKDESYAWTDDQIQAISLERFHMAYSVLFTLFADRWRVAAPRNAMEFPLIFGPFKKEVEQMITTPEGIAALAAI